MGLRKHIVNYKKRDDPTGERRTPLVNVGFWIRGVPRPAVRCRLLGHRPTVDGVDFAFTAQRSRWVACARCGQRGQPQGRLPEHLEPGERYDGPWGNPPVQTVSGAHRGDLDLPGPIGKLEPGMLGGQLVIGVKEWSIGAEVKVGNAGSEHILAANVHLGPVGSLYLHTSDGLGRGVVQLLNRFGTESKVCALEFRRGHRDHLEWKLWADRDNYDRQRRWRAGSVHIKATRPLDWAFGHPRYWHLPVPAGVANRVVRLPDGDYPVALTLRRQIRARERRGRPMTRDWLVSWEAIGKPIPAKGPSRGRVFGAAVKVSHRSVLAGTWPAEACAQITVRTCRERTSYGWEPSGQVHVQVEQVDALDFRDPQLQEAV